jgi:serine/threonine-protein kinase
VSRAAEPARPGSRLPGKIAGYRLDKYVGQGSRAAVYLAEDERLHRQVALKVLAPELARDAAFRTRMIRESRAAAAVDHPHIIPVYEADEASGTLYVAMRYVRGGDARSLLNRLGPLPFGYAWHLIAQIASALDAAHAHGLIHRDVRPANILLDASDTSGRGTPSLAGDHAYLSDFGMSELLSPGQVIATGQFAGTLDYVAPEQIEGRALDGRADLYSLACAGFELLCGTPPFGQDQGLTLMYAQLYAPPPRATAARADLPAALDLVLASALAKNPADRYPSCGQFAEELQAALGLRPGESADLPQSRSLGRARPVAESGAAAEGQPAAAPAPVDALEPVDTLDPVDTMEPVDTLDPMDTVDPADPLAPLAPDPMDEPNDLDLAPPAQHRRVLVLILAAVVIVIAAPIALGVALSMQSIPGKSAVSIPAASSRAAPALAPSSASSLSASEQAAAVSTLLTSSTATRTALHDAIVQVGACTNLDNAVSRLQNVVNQRITEDGRASTLRTSALPDGTSVKSDLIAALNDSLRADRDYLTWAQQQLGQGCTPTDQSTAYRAAISANRAADASKEAFVRVWSPVAAKYGVKQDSPLNI